ncbi:hypothetical protein AB0K18_20095 [Nonomuraea sp. NPDC049421]|uniref:hypothetical protein n=1 Tax=Nonomuraea sp. NPDC049421 TaxID=3155275 RepID=UPI003416E8F8
MATAHPVDAHTSDLGEKLPSAIVDVPPALVNLAPSADATGEQHESTGLEPTEDHEERGDPHIQRAHTWSVADADALRRRRRRVQRIIEDGGMSLHPMFLEWLRYVLNWDEVEKTLPIRRSNGRWHHRAGRKSMSGYTLYYLDLMVPVAVLLQQVLNYRIGIGRNLPKVPTLQRPVSMATGMAASHGSSLVTLLHTYSTAEGLQQTLRDAHQKVKAYREKQHGWTPLRDLIYRDGVEDGGLWMQTVFAQLNPDGSPNLESAQAGLAPADAASRKAVCDDRIDPEGKLAAMPLLAPRRADIYPDASTDPQAPVTIAESVGMTLGHLKRVLSTSAASYLDELDDDVRERLHTTVMPVRLVYAVEDNRGRPANLDAVALFREIQEHFHGQDHLGHPDAEAERLVADKAREALYAAIDGGHFTVVNADARTNKYGEKVPIEWTHELIAVLAGHGQYSDLASLGLPADRMGAGVAAAMLVYGNGPERAVIGKALGSKRNGGSYNNIMAERRANLLREMTFPDLDSGVNKRVFEPLSARALMDDPPIRWDGDTDALVAKVSSRTATEVERALFDIVTIVAGVENRMSVVDLGSQGTARGFFRPKTFNAVAGMDATVDKERGIKHHVKVPSGEIYIRELLKGRLLWEEPTPEVIAGIQLDAPSTGRWQQWADSGTGLLEEDGTPKMREVVATVLDADGNVCKENGEVKRTLITVPVPVPREVLDSFSTQRMQTRASDAYKLRGGGQAVPRPETIEERVHGALERFVTNLSYLTEVVDTLEEVGQTGHLFSEEHHQRLEGISRDLRNMVNPLTLGALTPRLDALISKNEIARTQAQANDVFETNSEDMGDEQVNL